MADKPVDWTSGSLESLDIANEGELYAKRPLGVATLGGRVRGGEKFHMEYFVSGTRTATRDAIYRADLQKIAGCSAVTHFVHAYKLGRLRAWRAGDSSRCDRPGHLDHDVV